MEYQNPQLVSTLPVPLEDPVCIHLGRGTLEEVYKEYAEFVLQKFNFNRTHAARSLGISVRTLQRKMKKWKTKVPPVPGLEPSVKTLEKDCF